MKSLKSLLFVIGLILVSLSSHAWAQNLSYGQTQTGTISEAAQTNKYTFTANGGNVVDLTLVTTSGSLVPKILLYNPNGTLNTSNNSGAPYGCSGSAVEINTVQLVATGVYTVLVGDCADTNTGNYAIYLQSTNNPSGAVSLPFGQTEAGTIGSAAQSITYTFSGNANDEVDFTLVTTNGSLIPRIRLYNADGTLNRSNNSGAPYGCSGSTVEMNAVTLPSTGAYTVLVGDCADANTGNYEIYSQRTDSPAGTGLFFGQTQTGTIGSVAQSNTYTFSANANDVLDFTLVTTSGSLVPRVRLYNSDGTLNSSNNSGAPYGCSGSTVEMNTVQIPATPATGIYTVLVGDCSDTNTGNYSIYSQRTNNPTGAANLPFAQVQTGLLGSAAQSYTYTFSGNANDVVDFTLVTTNGSLLVPKIRLYNPAGTLNSSNNSGAPYGCSGSTVEMNTVMLPSSGAYTVLVGDCSDTNTGNFAIYAQSTRNPSGAIPMLWGQVQPGTIASPAQSTTYTFLGSASDVVDFTMVTISGSGSLVPRIRLYNPDGTLNSSNNSGAPYGCSGSTVEMNSVNLSQNGPYTVLLGDCGDTNTGNYNLSSQCIGTCPVTPGVTLSPTSLSFSNQPVGTTSASSAVTVTNNGTASVTFASIAVTGDFAIAASGTTCSVSTPYAAGSSCVINVTFTPTATGSRSGSLTLTDNATGSPQQVADLNGTGTTSTSNVSVNPTSVSFGTQPVGTTHAASAVTVTNSGTASLTFTSIAATGDFAIASGTTCSIGTPVTAGSNCVINVTFTPTVAGSRSGSLTLTDNASNSPQSVALSGTGTAPVAGVSPPSLTFSNQNVGTTSASQPVTLSNTGTVALTITSIATSANFGETNNCGSSVVASGSCTINVTFSPTEAGPVTGTLTIIDNSNGVAGSTQTDSLSGTGTGPVLSLSAPPTFSGQMVGTTSPSQTVTLTNTGNASLTFTAIAVTGPFAIATSGTTCSTSNPVAAEATCTVAVAFTPTAAGSASGRLSFTDNAPNSPQTLSLSGTGTGPVVSLSAPPIFPAEPVGTTSPSQTVTLTNTGNASLSLSAISVTGPFAVATSGSTCSTSNPVAAAATCTLAVTFTPTAAGTASGNLSFSDNAPNSPQTTALSGTGQDFTLAVASGSSSSASVAPGQTATYTLSVTGEDGFNQSVSFTCTEAISEATCTAAPSPVTPGSSATSVTVTVTTTEPSGSAPRTRHLPPVPPLSPGLRGLLMLALLLAVIAWAVMRRNQPGVSRWRPTMVSLASGLLLTLALAGCGGGGSSSPTPNPGTPPGNNTLTVTGTAGSGSSALSHNVALTLKVS